MGRFFDLDSPLMSALNKLADLIILNILVIICSLPVFTIGASMTALHYVVLKMVRNEEGYIIKSFFKSFKQNFRQATIIWLILLVLIGVLIGDFLILRFSAVALPQWLHIVILAIAIILLFATVHLFPVLSRFENTILNTYRYSFFMGILALPKTVVMMVCWIIPLVVMIFAPQIMPVVFVLGISGPAFLNAMLYNKTFKRFEPENEIVPDEEWSMQPLEGQEEEAAGEGGNSIQETAEQAIMDESGVEKEE